MNDHSSNDWLDGKARQAMIDNDFEPDFSEEIKAQIASITARDLLTEASGAKDLRHLEWSSIDNATSRDLDQVEWAEELAGGDIRMLVGIADVDPAKPAGAVEQG